VLKKSALGWPKIAGLGIALVVGGQFSGWNFGLLNVATCSFSAPTCASKAASRICHAHSSLMGGKLIAWLGLALTLVVIAACFQLADHG
jgi:hypothetical protein